MSWDWELEFTRSRDMQQWARTLPDAFAAEFRRRRTASGMSQQHVANTMALIYGHRAWRQATVAQVEAGKREIKLGEAAALAAIIGVPLPELLMTFEQPLGDPSPLREIESDGKHPEET